MINRRTGPSTAEIAFIGISTTRPSGWYLTHDVPETLDFWQRNQIVITKIYVEPLVEIPSPWLNYALDLYVGDGHFCSPWPPQSGSSPLGNPTE